MSEQSALHFSFVLHVHTSPRQTGKKDPAGLIAGEQQSNERGSIWPCEHPSGFQALLLHTIGQDVGCAGAEKKARTVSLREDGEKVVEASE